VFRDDHRVRIQEDERLSAITLEIVADCGGHQRGRLVQNRIAQNVNVLESAHDQLFYLENPASAAGLGDIRLSSA
jgi:hypothetical protein